jgi:hypothetical protein
MNNIIKNPTKQILVLIDESNFFLKYTFQVPCFLGEVLYTHSFRRPHRKKFGSVMSGERAGHGVCPKLEMTLWKRLRTTYILQCDFLASFVPKFSCLCPGCVNVVDLSNVGCAEMISLLCEHFVTHTS